MEALENKIIIVDGPQGVGKSYLINDLMKTRRFYHLVHFNFGFSFWINELNKFDDISFKNGISVGKDLSLFRFLYSIKNYPNLIVERSFLSHVVWSILEDREHQEEINTYVKLINDLIKNMSVHLVLVHGENTKYKRNKKDGYDNKASYEKQISLYCKHSNKFLFKSKELFQNNFNLTSKKKFRELIGVIIDEH